MSKAAGREKPTLTEPNSKRQKLTNGKSKEKEVDDVRIERLKPLVPPACLLEELPITTGAKEIVRKTRKQIEKILDGDDDRLLVIVGPCSIHDPVAALEYGEMLRKLADELKEDLLIVMRVYFEKPRTTVGWKGLINDPLLDDSYEINKGLKIARKLLLDLSNKGLALGCEFLDTISPQFTADLVSWGAIGARTTESQVHRELASGLSCPIGFKNGTNGDIQIAVDAIRASAHPHSFLGVSKEGLASIVCTKGNSYCHVILRGGLNATNYSKEDVQCTQNLLSKFKVRTKIMVDCSHGNSQKDHKNQPMVAADLANQIASGNSELFGVMLESNLVEGRQDLVLGKPLVYGKSITDACIDFPTTEHVLRNLAKAVQERRRLLSNKS
eukprot:TRINITY_DN1636_c0_g1_i1.p1 TRINITY_DN1636_c0_g1~~TRINITY_DN1636_c0_g1_i1.p1  ORF type:complete len:385 (+),score=72.80 TRINITY_DN1636_c0_g1_i1:68-1222(+)